MKEQAQKLYAELIANDIIAEINSPSEIRARFGTKEDLDAYINYWKEHNTKQDEILKQLADIQDQIIDENC